MKKDLEIAPGADKWWSLDWADPAKPFLESGETIVSHTVAVSSGLTLLSAQLVGTKVFVHVAAAAGLREGQRPSIVITVTTSKPRTEPKRIRLTCDYGEIA